MTARTHVMLVAIGAWSTLAIAQPPEGRDGPPPGRGDTIRQALDTNGDHELDADEIKNAATNLAKADKNGDGTIDRDEFRPPMPPMPRGEGGFRGPPPRDAGPEAGRPRESAGDGPPPEGRPMREGRPLRDGALRAEGGPRDGGPPPEGGPSPERFVERAMTFDADGDGKLDRTEMEKFAGEVMQRMRAMAGRGMGPGGERGGGFRPEEGPRRRPGGGEADERPERPRRPE